MSRLCLPGPDLQRVQHREADLLSESECGPVLIPHHRYPWEALLSHSNTARPARHRSIRWHKDIRQANDTICVMRNGASHHVLVPVGDDEDKLRIGEQCWQKETRVLGRWIVRWAAAPGCFPLCQLGRALDAGPEEP